MSFSQGDVVWLKIDNLEGGLGKPHPCIVVSRNAFNDSHEWGMFVRGSHTIPTTLLAEELVIQRNPENGLDRDTVFGSIIFSARWTRVSKLVGKIPPAQIKQITDRINAILKT